MAIFAQPGSDAGAREVDRAVAHTLRHHRVGRLVEQHRVPRRVRERVAGQVLRVAVQLAVVPEVLDERVELSAKTCFPVPLPVQIVEQLRPLDPTLDSDNAPIGVEREALETLEILSTCVLAVRGAKRLPNLLPNAVFEFRVRRRGYW